jgi:hypothetical protein
MSDTLKSLLDKQQEISEQLLESYGEILPEIESALKELELNLPEKVDRCAGFLDRIFVDSATLKARGDAIKAHADAYLDRAKQLDTLHKNFMNHIRQQMLANGLTILGGLYESFKISSKQGSVVIEEDAVIPRSFITQTVSETINKSLVKEAVLRGEVFKGVTFIPTIKKVVKGMK